LQNLGITLAVKFDLKATTTWSVALDPSVEAVRKSLIA